jgi:hypothetical protein
MTFGKDVRRSRQVQAVLIWIGARKRMHQVPSGKTTATPARKPWKAAR